MQWPVLISGAAYPLCPLNHARAIRPLWRASRLDRPATPAFTASGSGLFGLWNCLPTFAASRFPPYALSKPLADAHLVTRRWDRVAALSPPARLPADWEETSKAPACRLSGALICQQHCMPHVNRAAVFPAVRDPTQPGRCPAAAVLPWSFGRAPASVRNQRS